MHKINKQSKSKTIILFQFSSVKLAQKTNNTTYKYGNIFKMQETKGRIDLFEIHKKKNIE